MKLSFASNAFKQDSLLDAIKVIGGIGYVGVELMADMHHAYPLTFDNERRKLTRDVLRDRGMFVSNVNAFTHFVDGDTYRPTWIERDLKQLQKRIDHTNRSLEMAAEFGCKTLSIQPGGPLIGREMSYDEAGERFAESLARCLETARATGVYIGIEPEPGLFIQTADEFRRFKQRHFKDEPMVKMNCDIGHLFCVGDDPATVIRELSGDIVHVHLEDIGANRVHQHLTPGKGVINFQSIFDALHDVSYQGHATVELYPYETSAAGVARMAFEHLCKVEN
jgi:sugar phosphate isomerase/epimerase